MDSGSTCHHRKSSDEVIGSRNIIRQTWLFGGTFDIIKLNYAAKLRNDHTERNILHGIFEATPTEERNVFLSRRADEAEDNY